MSRAVEESNRRMLRARDAMDRAYAEPLNVPELARLVHVSEAHFIRTFRATFGETPYRYLQRRRVERAMFLLRQTDRSVTEICLDVGFTSLGTFSRTFRGLSPKENREIPPLRYDVDTKLPEYRARGVVKSVVPNCFARAWLRPSSFGEAVPPDRQ